MTYSIKDIFYTLQGEGFHTGRPAVFCRFSGCNLWSGRENDRSSAICQFCDTDFVGTNGSMGGKYSSADELAERILFQWPANNLDNRFVVCTGGEPLLQLDEQLIEALHKRSFEIAIETNGTILPPSGIDWVCVSPKAGASLNLHRGDELKLVIPQSGINPSDFENLEFSHFMVQPMDGPQRSENLNQAILFCLENPKWILSIQTHKIIGVR